MKCAHAQQWILQKDSGELSPRRQRILEHHIAHCAACRDWQADMLVITRLAAKSCPPLEPPEPAVRVVLDRARRQRAETPQRRWPWLWPLAAAATLLLALGGWMQGGSIRAQMLARRQSHRAQEIQVLAALLGGMDGLENMEILDPASRDEALRALARQILLWQDSGSEETTMEGGTTPPGAPPPTALQDRSSRAVPAERCG